MVIVTEVLLKSKVKVQQKPSDIESAKTWTTECDKATSAFNRILKDVQKKKPPDDTAFFDSSQFTLFAKVQRPKLEAKRGAKKKVISPEIKESESRLFKERAQHVREELLKFFKKEGLNVSTGIARLGSMILHDTTDKENFDPKIGSIFKKIANGTDPFKEQEVDLSATDALVLQSTLEIGNDRYVNMSQFLRKRKINCPNTAKIKKRRMEIVPDPDDCFDDGKWCPLPKLLKTHVTATIEHLTSIKDVPKVLKIKAVVGFDGNGKNSCHRNFKNGHHFILGGVALNSIEDEEGNMEYEETSLGADTEVPYFIIPRKENHIRTKKCFKKLESEVNFLNKNSITAEINGSEVELKFEIKITQGDSKVWKEVLRINGAFCKHCELKRRDAAKASVIKNGFRKTRSSQGIIDQWYQLMDKNEIGLSADIKEVYKNSDSRFNISHFPYGTGQHF